MQHDSFIDFLDRYGKVFAPELTYREGMDFAKWKSAFRARLDDLTGPLPPRVPLSVETVSTTPCIDHVRHELLIRVTDLTTLPAYLLVPNDLKAGEKRPGILALHGHTTYGCEMIAGLDNDQVRDEPFRAYGRDAVRAGYVVLAPAWWGWAGRDGHAERAGRRDQCNVIQMAAAMYGVNVLALHIQDGQAALDVLAQRPEVDPDRLGCIGNSYGGRTAMWLTAFDDRIAACVASGCMNTFRERSLRLGACGIQYLPGILKYGDVADIFCLAAPRALQLMISKEDKLMKAKDIDAIHATVRAAYRAAQADDQLDYAQHPYGHRIVWELAEPFLRKHLVQ